MKPQSFALLVGTLLIMAVGLLVLGPITRRGTAPQSVAVPQAAAPARLITVTGTSDMWVKPNLAGLSIVLKRNGASAQEAEALAGAFADTIRKQVTGLKLAQFEMQSGQVHVGKLEATPSSAVPAAEPPRTLYVASVHLFLATSDLTRLDDVKSIVWELGGEVENVRYTLAQAEAEAARKTALAAALSNATGRASMLAAQDGSKVGQAQNVTTKITRDAPAPFAQTEVEAPTGMVQIQAEVTATYTLN